MDKLTTLKKWVNGEKPGPLRIDLNLTNKCNQKCVYCYLPRKEFNYTNELTTEEIIRLIKEASQLGTYNWNLRGGEPLFESEKTSSAMQEIKKYNMFGNLTTNGTLFDSKAIEKIVLLRWDCINFSADSADEKVHDQLRGKGSLKRVKYALRQFKEIKNKLNKTKPTIVVHSVLTKKNFKQIKRLIKFAKKNGVHKLELTYVMPFSKQAKRLSLNKKEITEFKNNIPQLISFSKRNNLETNLGSYLDSIETKQARSISQTAKSDYNKSIVSSNCFAPWTTLMISPNWYVGPCCRFNKKVGNIRKSSLKEVWYGNKINDFRNKIENNQMSTCKICPSTEVAKNTKIKEALEKSAILKITKLLGCRKCRLTG